MSQSEKKIKPNNLTTESSFVSGGEDENTRFSIEENTLKMEISSAKSTPATMTLLVGPKRLVGFSWTLLQPIITIGRSGRLSDISVDHDNLSRSHFQLIKKGDQFYIKDLNSTNKTYKNDEVLNPDEEYEVFNNDLIRAGDIIFKFLTEGSVESLSRKSFLDKAYKDSLTSAHNRQFLEMKGQELFKDLKKLCLIVFDLDSFKFTNDNYGHLAGDYVLKTIVKLIYDIIRDGDFLFRYGGDEFCIFTPSSLEVGKNIIERINTSIEAHSFVFEDQKIKVSISLGISCRESGDKKWEDIYKRADENCYAWKSSKKKTS
ncbi:MAG: diguanylate cyclase [Bdellovibrionales bacterium]